jgi:hypothetical protein
MKAQPWHFIVVEDRETLHKLGQIVQTGRSIAQATLAIVVAIDKTRLSVSDASRAIQSMILTAWSVGVGSNWTGFMGLEEVNALLSLPGELDVLAVLPFGYPAQPSGRGKKRRKALSEIIHRERFGQPFEPTWLSGCWLEKYLIRRPSISSKASIYFSRLAMTGRSPPVTTTWAISPCSEASWNWLSNAFSRFWRCARNSTSAGGWPNR